MICAEKKDRQIKGRITDRTDTGTDRGGRGTDKEGDDIYWQGRYRQGEQA